MPSYDKMIKISVITSVYNTPIKFLKKYFTMLEAQNLKDYEIIIIDDGSTETETKQYLNIKYSENADRIVLISLENNKGISYCRNIGLSVAQGEYVAILDSDDWCCPNFMQDMYIQATQDKADMIMCGYNICNESESILEKVEATSNLFFQFASSISPRLFRRAIINKRRLEYPVGCLIEDLSFNAFLVYYCENVSICDSYLYNIRIHEKSTSHDTFSYTRLNLSNIPLNYIKANLEKIIDKEKSTRYRAMCGQIIMVLYGISCIWDRNSNLKLIFQISKKCGQIIRQIPNYYICAAYYHKENLGKGITSLGAIVYTILVKIRCEGIGAVIITQTVKMSVTLMNFIKRLGGKKN